MEWDGCEMKKKKTKQNKTKRRENGFEKINMNNEKNGIVRCVYVCVCVYEKDLIKFSCFSFSLSLFLSLPPQKNMECLINNDLNQIIE